MTRAGDGYRVKWSDKAKKRALELATPIRLENGRVAPALSYRTIADELFNLGMVDRKVDSATVRRMVVRLRQEQRHEQQQADASAARRAEGGEG
jgi:hypothetical protein